jgi:hypothetical protein
MTDITHDRERIRAYLASLPPWRCERLDNNSKVLFDTCSALMDMVDGLSHRLDELDFLHHEGGPQSVAAMEAALKPFADFCAQIDAHPAAAEAPDDKAIHPGLTVGDFRRARRAFGDAA